MTKNGSFHLTSLSIALSTFLVLWSSGLFAAPFVGSLGANELAVANRLLNEILRGGSRDAADATDLAIAETSEVVPELMNAARSKILATLQSAKISGDLEVRSGTFSDGFLPPRDPDDVSGSRHINLLIYQNGSKLGALAVGKSYQGSSVTPYADFTRTH